MWDNKQREGTVMKRLSLIIAFLLTGMVISNCAPMIGAGAVIAADEAAEREGGNLF